MYFIHNQFFTTIITEDNRIENVSYFKMHTICCKSLSEQVIKQILFILRPAGYEYIWRRINTESTLGNKDMNIIYTANNSTVCFKI